MKAENNNKRRAVLEMMASGFNSRGAAAAVINKGVDDAVCDILSVVHESIKTGDGAAHGRYYFPEYDFAAENVQYFSAAIELTGPLGDKEKDLAFTLCGQINPELPCGAFVVYENVGLVYNLNVPLTENLSEGELFEQVNITVGNAIAMTEAYADRFTSEL